METVPVKSYRLAGQPFGLPNFPQCKRKNDPDYLNKVADYVSTHRPKAVPLKKPDGAIWKIGNLDDTIYRKEHRIVNGWGKFYLPKKVSMQVIGVVEGILCPCDQLVLMTCEDAKLYAYDGEELHLVASSGTQLNEEGIKYPASKTYYRGERFQNMTEEDWAEVKKGAVGRRLEQEHYKLVTAKDSKFLENLRSTAVKTTQRKNHQRCDTRNLGTSQSKRKFQGEHPDRRWIRVTRLHSCD